LGEPVGIQPHARTFCLAVGVALALAFGAASPAAAQGKSEDKFTFEVTPYLWAAGINGDAAIGTIAGGGIDVDVDASFSDIFQMLDMAFMGMIEGRYGRWGLLLDAVYMQLHDTETTADDRGSAKFKLQQQLYSLAPMYRVLDEDVFIDAFAGVRFLYLKSELTIPEGRHPLLSQGRHVEASESWWGGFVGARVAWPLPFYKPVSLVGYLDVGAMDGNFMWQGIAGANWQISQTFSAKLGYRYLSYDVGSGPADFNLDTSGFYAGVGIKF